MGDYNGRIGQIVREFGKYPAGDINTRITVREVLAAERAEGFKAGYSEGIYDAGQAQASDEARAEVERSSRPPWHENWEDYGRDGNGNLLLHYMPEDAVYRVIPVEDGQ